MNYKKIPYNLHNNHTKVMANLNDPNAVDLTNLSTNLDDNIAVDLTNLSTSNLDDNIEPILNKENRRFTVLPIKYQSVWDLYKKQQSLFWKAEEIDFSKDYDDFKKLDEDEKHFVKMILAFFAASDGIVNFNLRERFLNDVQIIEAQTAYAWQMMMEGIHCVSGNTKIMTDSGYHKIIDLVNKNINVWNGKEFSETQVKYTGDSVLYRVTLSNGMILDCTPDHKWFLSKGNHTQLKKHTKEIVFTENLKINDIIYDYNLPIIDTKDIDNFKNPYVHGFFCGNGYYSNNLPMIYLYGDRMKLIDYFNTSIVRKTTSGYKFCISDKINKDKYFVPINYSKYTKIKWLEGLCDNNGYINYCTNKTDTSILIFNTNLLFLQNVQLLLTTLGIHSNIKTSTNHKNILLKEINVQKYDKGYMLYLETYYVKKLGSIGFNPKRLNIKFNNISNHKNNKIKIKSVIKLQGIHKTFCFCEEKEHAGIFNGILTGQSEVYSQMLENIVKNPNERIKLFNAIETVNSVKLMAEWAFKWIESKKSFAYRLVAFAIVEGIFFSGAFAAIFWLKKYRGKGKHFLNGLIKSNEYIARDEGMHVEFACALYKLLLQKLPKDEIYSIMDEAIDIALLFTNDAIQCKLIGMNSELMSQYIQYIGDRLLVMLGYPKKYFKKNPFGFMESIGLAKKVNFFENRSTDYQSAHNPNNRTERKILRLDKF